MKKRLLNVLLLLCMLLTLLPTAAFAEEAHEHVYEEAFACICTVECTEENRNADCPACGAEDARPEDCALYTGQVEAPALEEEEMPEEADASVDADGQHVHCFCGGSVLAGNHTSHSDVTYQPWSGTSSITYTNNTAYVYLTENATLSGHLTVDGKTLYLCLNGKTLASNGTAKIQVKNGGRLVLCDCRGGGTFKGATQSVWGGACIYLYTSTLDMFGGKLTGGKVTGKGGGGAIALDDQQCIFNMYGGEISGNNGKNYGGAIFRKFNANMPNTTGGTFNMYGGTIKNNTAKNGGAFFSTTGGTINMTGGTISGNTATMNSNDAGGGAIYMRGNGKINISGSAQITGNSSSLDGGAILMGWGEINISGSAKINSNTASRWGGAICLRQDSNQSTTLCMRGGEISDNKANSEGGAVHVLDKDCQFFLYDGKITRNTSGDGGAIYLNQEPSWLIMQGGEISGNTATGNGGGVYIYRTGSVCQLYSGKIENNKASGNGGGIYINPSNSGQLRVGNEPLVQNNTVSGKANNVYLPSGKTLTIEIGMSKGASVGVTTANTSYPVAFSNNYKKDYSNYFFADDANAHVEYKDDQKLYLVSGAVARPLTVTFDPNGGMLAEADKTKSLMTGEPYGTLPVPSYAGYDFIGWYTEQNGGTEIKENTTVTVFGTQTLYAHWTPIHVHAYTQQVQKPEALKTPADCTNNAVYYLSCACGEVSTNDADTFTAANTALDHDWGAWTQNSDEKTHTRICKRDTSHTETENCHGGTATCTARAVCTVCGGEYGELLAHDFTAEIAEAKYLKSGATCTEKAVYYKSCAACGLSSAGTASEATFEAGNVLGHDWGAWTSNGNDTHTRVCKRDSSHTETDNCSGGTATCTAKAVCTVCGGEYGELLPHDFTAEIAEAKYLKSGSTCTEKAVYYKSCAACGLSSAGTASEATFEAGNVLGHDWGAWASNGNDTHTRVCKRDGSHTETDSCSGGTATCTAKAVCTVCGGEYGELLPHDFTAEIAEAKYLKSGATCTEKAVYYKSCAACGLSSAGTASEATFEAGNVLGHDWGAWTSNGNDTHTRVCKRDGSHTETDSCSGGTATCTAKAVCTVCGGEYGELLPHDFTAEIAEAKYLKSGATCTEKAVYYKSCAACGLSSAGTAFEATFEAGNVLGHDWNAWTSNGNDTHTRVCKRDSSHTETDNCSGGTATCTARAVCAVCGGEYGALAPNNHTGTIYWVTTETTHEGRYTCCEAVAVPMEPHAFGEWVVIYKATAKVWGIVERTCSVCGHQERKDVAPLDGAAAYVLKFETNGGSRISDVYAPYDTKIDLSKYEPVKDGYRFTGWYLDRMLTEEVTSVRMTKNVTVYAGWRRTELPFIDVRGDDWFYDDVAYVYENGLMNGTSETTFSPYISTTRGMIVTILYRMEGKPAVLEACPFTDVKAGAYYERAIVWAAENGIVKGYGNGCFGPDDQITREQMAAILYRYAKNRGLDVSVGENTNILSYDDALDISEYAVPAMQWACGAQIIHGADGRLTPGAKATRAQVAAILHRFCENVLKP